MNDLPTASDLARLKLPAARVRSLRAGPPRPGKYVLYWMQASLRTRENAALELAATLAHQLQRPLMVLFCLTENYPGANLRHYRFLLQSLADVRTALTRRNLSLSLYIGEVPAGVLRAAGRAAVLVTDCGYTRVQRQWRRQIAQQVQCPMIEVEDNVVVPTRVASEKEEYAARTIRPKILRQLDDYLEPIRRGPACEGWRDSKSLDGRLDAIDRLLGRMKIDRTVAPSDRFSGGEQQARRRLKRFLRDGLNRYDQRNDPCAEASSGLSPYLHFGCISPAAIARQVSRSGSPGAEDFIEQLVVRRELAVNFVLYNDGYDRGEAIPSWARQTLHRHRRDPRTVYSFEQLRDAATDDRAWNAAQHEMLSTGYMAGYMRMYWGKRVLTWSRTAEEALETLLRLNDTYELDGRDPNGYCGIAWCFGRHDRPWPERAVFGTVRSMVPEGLARKFDVRAYIERWHPE